jgi:hypothetical protein
MAEIHVTGDFNVAACDGCPAQAECNGFKLVDGIRKEFYNNYANPVISRFTEALEQTTLYPNDHGRRNAADSFNIAKRRFNGVLIRSKQIEKMITTVVAQSIESQIIPDADVKLSNLDLAFAVLSREANILPDNPIVIEDLDHAGADVRYYASRGICGAINVVEVA